MKDIINSNEKLDLKDIIVYAEEFGPKAAADLMLLAGHDGVNFESDLYDDILKILKMGEFK